MFLQEERNAAFELMPEMASFLDTPPFSILSVENLKY